MGNVLPNGSDRQGEQLCAAIVSIIAVHTRDHRVTQAESGARLSDTAWLIVIDLERSAFLHRAEPASARADVAENHKCSGAPVPAFADVWTCGALAYRV